MPKIERYHAAAIQTAFENPRTRDEIPSRVARMIAMAEQTVAGYAPFFDVRLVAFPEFAHAAPVYFTVEELLEHLAVELPNDHTDAYARFARKTGCFVQTGTFIERDARYPGGVFNTTCPATARRCSPSRTPRSAASAARSATTGSSPRRSGSLRSTARRCWCA